MSITVSNIKSGYDRFALKGVDAEIEKGSLTALIGPNGCGKSTLLKTISRHLPAQGGSVRVEGQDIAKMRTKAVAHQIAALPQHPIVPPGITVEQLVGYGRAPYQNLLGIQSAEDRAHVAAALKTVTLTDLKDRVVSELSGGQRQRAFIAMCIAQDTPYILLDEPTSFLDIRYQFDVLDLMATLNAAGKTIVVVLHDIAQAARYASNILIMQDGALITQGAPDQVISEELISSVYDLNAKVYTDPISGSLAVSPLRR